METALPSAIGAAAQNITAEEFDAIVRRHQRRVHRFLLMLLRDPEMKYLNASLLGYCGQEQAAFDLLRSAIEQNYCASSALQVDPLWARLREKPQFSELQALANQCQSRFLSALTQPGR